MLYLLFMEGLQQYLVPYLFSQVAAIVFVMIAYQNTKVTRLLFAIVFLGASATNLSAGLKEPNVYLTYANMALPFYEDFINGWFSGYNHIIVPLIATGQFLIALGMVLRGWWVKGACIGAVVFLLAITPLMTGSAFPFPLLVSWAAWLVLKRDEKNYLWRASRANRPLANTRTIRLSPAAFLSWIAWMLAVVATTTGLFAPSIYQDNAFVQTAWQANDWVTLLLVLPALLVVQLMIKGEKVRLVWAGLLGYLIYNYAFYLFGAAFNANFLVYAGIIAGSIWALVDLLRNIPVHTLQSSPKKNKWIAGYLFFIAAMLLAIEVPPAIGFGTTGVLPEIVTKSNHPTSIVYALDLTLICPALIVAGYWLWKAKPWGILLAAIMLVKAATYGVVLCAGSLLLMSRNVDRDPLLPFYIVIAAGGIAGLAALLRSVNVNSSAVNKTEPVVKIVSSSRKAMMNQNNS